MEMFITRRNQNDEKKNGTNSEAKSNCKEIFTFLLKTFPDFIELN
jgi:hypothetical protein